MSPKATKTTRKRATKKTATTATGKRRGRPPKSAAATTPARRGRPPNATKGSHGGRRAGAGAKKVSPDGTRTESFVLHPRHSQILDAICAAMGPGTSRSDALRAVIIAGAKLAYTQVLAERQTRDAIEAQVLEDLRPLIAPAAPTPPDVSQDAEGSAVEVEGPSSVAPAPPAASGSGAPAAPVAMSAAPAS